MSNRIQVHEFEDGLKCRTKLQVYPQWGTSQLFVEPIDEEERNVGEPWSLARFEGTNPDIEIFTDEVKRRICVRHFPTKNVLGSASIDKMHRPKKSPRFKCLWQFNNGGVASQMYYSVEEAEEKAEEILSKAETSGVQVVKVLEDESKIHYLRRVRKA